MRRRALAVAVTAAVVAAIAVLAVRLASSGDTHHRGSHAIRVGSAPVDVPITIASDIALTFTPRSGPPSAALTSDAAYERFTGGHDVPDGVTVEYGTLTMPYGAAPPGPDTQYAYRDLPVWAYSDSECMSKTGGGGGLGPTGSTPTAPTPPAVTTTEPPVSDCVLWNFLDATTGEQVVETQQR